VQAVKEQTEYFINGCKIYGRNCGTAEFRALQIFKNTSGNAKFLYSIFIEFIGCISFPLCQYALIYVYIYIYI